MSAVSLTPYLGEGLLNVGDFFSADGILHPLAIGSIAIIFLFGWLRLSSNRTVAPLTIWDKVVSIALGSTLAGIINGNSLVRGLIAVTVLLLWQYATSMIGTQLPKAAFIFTKPPMVIAFRGRLLEGLMKKHRITEVDIYGSLRAAGIWNVCEIEAVILEPTGVFSIYRAKDLPTDYEPDVLNSINGYRDLVKSDEEEKQKQKEEGMSRNSSDSTRNDNCKREGSEERVEGKPKDSNEQGEDNTATTDSTGSKGDEEKEGGKSKGPSEQDKDDKGQSKQDQIADNAC